MRTIIVKIEMYGDTPFELIKDDIEQELSCCWNWFDKVEIHEELKGESYEKMNDLFRRQGEIDLRTQAAIIDELSKMPTMVIATAYLHAINYTLYGEDVTEKWLTATQNASALDKAYRKGYHDAMEKFTRK